MVSASVGSESHAAHSAATAGAGSFGSSAAKLDSAQRFAIDRAVMNYKAQLQSEPLKNAEYLKSLDATSKALGAIQ